MKRMTEDTKRKLLYCGELAIFAVIFIVLGILEVTKTINLFVNHPDRLYYLSAVGIVIGLADWVIYLTNKEKRENKSLFDKLVILPNLIFLTYIDINYFFLKVEVLEIQYFKAILFLYNGANYIAQSIYHWFRPIPGLIEDKTENLLIRRFRLNDISNYLLYINDKNILKYKPTKKLSDLEAEKDLEARVYSTDYYAVTDKLNGKLLGELYLHDEEESATLSFAFIEEMKVDLQKEALHYIEKEAFSNKVKKLVCPINEKDNTLIELIESVGFIKEDIRKGVVYFVKQNIKNK